MVPKHTVRLNATGELLVEIADERFALRPASQSS
jgi:hypothetical protein